MTNSAQDGTPTDGRPWDESARERLLGGLADAVTDEAMMVLRDAVTAIVANPTTIQRVFPSATRMVGRGPAVIGDDPDDPFTVMADDAARSAMVCALPSDQIADEIGALYRHGDTRERRGVLRALDAVPNAVLDRDAALRAAAVALVDDAMRTNDIRLVAAALGTTGVHLMDDESFAQAMLKCVFVGVDIQRVPALHDRVTPELSRMMADFVHERIAAGRDVPASVWTVIDAHPPAAQLAAILAEVDSPVERRAVAARAALALRTQS